MQSCIKKKKKTRLRHDVFRSLKGSDSWSILKNEVFFNSYCKNYFLF